VFELFTQINLRAQALREAVALTVGPLPTDSTGRYARAAETRRRVAELYERANAAYAAVPPGMRMPLARADDDLSLLQNILDEFAGLLELGRVEEAARREDLADSVMSELSRHIGDAQAAGVAHLQDREQALAGTARRAMAVMVTWFVAGGMLLAAALGLVRRRIRQPLIDLEAGLRSVAAGEMTTQVPVQRADELGRLAELFNQMTRVLRDRAAQQGRYAAAGELMAGVAHEVNNPLMAIASLAELRMADPGLAPELRAEMDQIRSQARRAAKLLSGLLRFVRPTEAQAALVDLNAPLSRALDLLAYRLPVENTTVERVLEAGLPAVRADPTRLEQVFVNLLSNALDSLRGVEPPRKVLVRTWAAGERVYAAVTDNGPGVPEDVRRRLFAPFVSTKAESAGLGLYMSRQIIRESGGELLYQPDGRPGSTFVIRLEAASGPATPVRTTPIAAARPAPLAGQVILVVDDEEPIRRVISLYLSRRGARAVTAVDGADALARIGEVAPDLILADLKMPGMSGTTLYQALQRDRPELAARVVFLSGDLTQLAELGTDHGVPPERILAKPIDLAELEVRILAVVGAQADREG
jgi:signal transduction histidine kinase/CheY-like chemotaxis protein